MKNDNQLFKKSVAAYQAHCNATGKIFDQPDKALSSIKYGYVVLRNGNGELARYDIDEQKIAPGPWFMVKPRKRVCRNFK